MSTFWTVVTVFAVVVVLCGYPAFINWMVVKRNKRKEKLI